MSRHLRWNRSDVLHGFLLMWPLLGAVIFLYLYDLGAVSTPGRAPATPQVRATATSSEISPAAGSAPEAPVLEPSAQPRAAAATDEVGIDDAQATAPAMSAPMLPTPPISLPTAAPNLSTTPTLAPTRTATPTVALGAGRVGVEINSPSNNAHVPSSLVVGGAQAGPTPRGLHVWCFVRADVPGSRWYPWHRGEILAGTDGTWAVDLYLGGPPGTRHEVRIGAVDDALHADLDAFLGSNPDQPLPDLPAGFVQEAQITVTLE